MEKELTFKEWLVSEGYKQATATTYAWEIKNNKPRSASTKQHKKYRQEIEDTRKEKSSKPKFKKSKKDKPHIKSHPRHKGALYIGTAGELKVDLNPSSLPGSILDKVGGGIVSSNDLLNSNIETPIKNVAFSTSKESSNFRCTVQYAGTVTLNLTKAQLQNALAQCKLSILSVEENNE